MEHTAADLAVAWWRNGDGPKTPDRLYDLCGHFARTYGVSVARVYELAERKARPGREPADRDDPESDPRIDAFLDRRGF